MSLIPQGPPGPPGPSGPPGPGNTNDLATTLGYGNTSGANDIVITAGQKLDAGSADADILNLNVNTINPIDIGVSPDIGIVGNLVFPGDINLRNDALGGGANVIIDSIPVAPAPFPNILSYDIATNQLYYQGDYAGTISAITAGTGISVDNTDPANPVIDNTGLLSASGTAPIATSTVGGALTISHSTSGVSAGSYTYASISVNATGHITSASSGTAPITVVPTLSQVLVAGNSAGATSINLNNQQLQNCSQITASGDLVLNPVGSIDANGKTLDMTNGEIHKVPLIHGPNNANIQIEAKGTGDIVFVADTSTKMTIPDTGSVSMAVGFDMNNNSITECNTVSGSTNTNLGLTALGTGDIVLTAGGATRMTILDTGTVSMATGIDMNNNSITECNTLSGNTNTALSLTALGTGDIVLTAGGVTKMTVPDSGSVSMGVGIDMNNLNITECNTLSGTSGTDLSINSTSAVLRLTSDTGGIYINTTGTTGDQGKVYFDLSKFFEVFCKGRLALTQTGTVGATAQLVSDATLNNGAFTFDEIPYIPTPDPTADGQVCSKKYADTKMSDVATGTTGTITVNTSPLPLTTKNITLDLAVLPGASVGSFYTTGLINTLDTYGRSIIQYQVTITATGGQTVANYRDLDGVYWKYHLFTTVGSTNFVVSAVSSAGEFPVEVLLLGGGGGGGNRSGAQAIGGAGGGEVIFVQGNQLTTGTYAVVVGDGGAGGTSASGSAGGNSSFNGIIAGGGGGGQIAGAGTVVSGTLPSGDANTGSGSGGGGTTVVSGGSATRDVYTTTSSIDPFTTSITTYTNNWSYASSGGTSAIQTSTFAGGGGGGAGAVGTAGSAPAPGTATGGNGGNGVTITGFYTNTPLLVGGGSGGCASASSSATAGTSATTFGAGTSTQSGGTPATAPVNRGGGGGNNANVPGSAGGKGGSGFVCIRYRVYA